MATAIAIVIKKNNLKQVTMPDWKKAKRRAKEGMPKSDKPLGPMPAGIKKKMMRKKNMGESFKGAYGGKR